MSCFIDFHCHLDLFPNFEELVKQCDANKIYTLAVTTTPRAWRRNKDISSRTKYVRAALGLHPQLVDQNFSELELMLNLLGESKYIGEIGIDGSKEYKPTINQQIHVFSSILERCVELGGGKIFSIHSRGAEDEVLHALREYSEAGKPILHWFTGNLSQLEKAIELDCWFSVGHAMLNTKKGIAAIEKIPRNRLLTETDGPFTKIAGGNAFSPLYVEQAVSLIATYWGVDYAIAKDKIFNNLQDLLKDNRD